MKQNKIAVIIIWSLSFILCYTLYLVGLLNSFVTGGSSYYFTLLVVFFLLFYHYCFYHQTNKPIRVRSLFKPFFQSFLLFISILLILSLVFPETFKGAELSGYEARFLANGYSASEISDTLKVLNKLYYLFLIIGSFITHFLFFLVTVLLFKIFVIIKSKWITAKD